VGREFKKDTNPTSMGQRKLVILVGQRNQRDRKFNGPLEGETRIEASRGSRRDGS